MLGIISPHTSLFQPITNTFSYKQVQKLWQFLQVWCGFIYHKRGVPWVAVALHSETTIQKDPNLGSKALTNTTAGHSTTLPTQVWLSEGQYLLPMEGTDLGLWPRNSSELRIVTPLKWILISEKRAEHQVMKSLMQHKDVFLGWFSGSKLNKDDYNCWWFVLVRIPSHLTVKAVLIPHWGVDTPVEM